METRDSWGTRLGFILAAVGSAVGLGNLWRFPWMTADNGGSAFLVVYLAVVVLVGVPGLLAEFVIGRRGERSPVGALTSLAGSERWRGLGLLSVGTAILLLSFYAVVGGWTIRYLLASPTGAYFGEPGTYFSTISYGLPSFAFALAFLALTALVVYGGIDTGIERAAKVMMPAILVLLVGLAAWALTLPGAGAGVDFYLAFDLATLRANFFHVLPAAAGQALFTLSLGAGTMLTYASYLSEDRSLPADATAIAVLNTLVGVLAGLVVFPLLFALGAGVGSGGPGAVFVSIAAAFGTLPYGGLLGTVFFGVVLLAALSSSISMLEIPVAYLVEEHGFSRHRAVLGLLVLFAVTSGACALSAPVFGFVAGTLVNLLLTAGLTGFLLFVGWVLGRHAVDEFRTGAGDRTGRLATPWLYAVAVVLPVFLLFTLVTGVLNALGVSLTPVVFGGVTLSASTLTVAAAVALALTAYATLRRPDSAI